METSGDEALAKLTQSGQIVGSLDFLPPERAQGREPSAASDIWALGMTLYAAVEGSSPFRRTSVWSTLSAIVTDPLPQAQRTGALTPVLQALMAKDPLQRPDAGQARELLEAVAEGRTADLVSAPAPQPVTPPGFGPAAPFFQPATPFTPADAYGAPPQPGAAQPVMVPGIPDGVGSRSETRATIVPARRRRTRTVVAVAAATVLTCGGVAYALMDMRGNAGGGSNAALPTESAGAGGDVSRGPTSPGDLASTSPSGTPSSTPSKKDDVRETTGPTPTPGGGGKSTADPSGPPKATPSAR